MLVINMSYFIQRTRTQFHVDRLHCLDQCCNFCFRLESLAQKTILIYMQCKQYQIKLLLWVERFEMLVLEKSIMILNLDFITLKDNYCYLALRFSFHSDPPFSSRNHVI